MDEELANIPFIVVIKNTINYLFAFYYEQTSGYGSKLLDIRQEPDTAFGIRLYTGYPDNYQVEYQISVQTSGRIPDICTIIFQDSEYLHKFLTVYRRSAQLSCQIPDICTFSDCLPDICTIILPDSGYLHNYPARSRIFAQLSCQIPDICTIILPDFFSWIKLFFNLELYLIFLSFLFSSCHNAGH